MKVLIVDAFLNESVNATHGRGKTGFQLFKAMVLKSLSTISVIPGAEFYATNPPSVQVVRVENLNDANLVCDWEHEVVDNYATIACLQFDLIDMIFIGGDSSMQPFDPRLSHLVTLCHMANKTNKPTFTCGGAALVEVVNFCCHGSKFNILNGNKGSSIENLPMFPKYTSSGSFVSVFLDSESGDMYSYDCNNLVWNPKCNAGIHRLSRSGKQLSQRLQSASISIHYATDDHVRDSSREVEEMQVDLDAKVHVVSKFSQHWAFHSMDNAAHAFVVTSLGEMQVNRDWVLPNSETRAFDNPLIVLATSKDAPILMQLGNKLVLAAEINDRKSKRNIEQLLKNFTFQMVATIVRDLEYDVYRRTFGSLHYCLFSGEECSDVNLRPMCKPISRQPVKSALPNGPVNVLEPTSNSFFASTSKKHESEVNKGNQVHKTSTGISKNKFIYLTPEDTTNRRLEALVSNNGQSVTNSIEIIRSIASSDTHVETSASSINGSMLHMGVVSPIRPRDGKPSSSFAGTTKSPRRIRKSPLASTIKNSGTLEVASDTNSAVNEVPDFNLVDNDSVLDIGTVISGYTQTADAVHTAFLPHHSPRSCKLANDDKFTRIMSPRAEKKPYNTYNNFLKNTKAFTETMKNQPYVGQYTEVFMSPREKEMKNEVIRKQTKFMSERNFCAAFGKSMALPLRKEGQIRAFSTYEADQKGMDGIKVADRITLKKDEKAKQIGGHWKKS